MFSFLLKTLQWLLAFRMNCKFITVLSRVPPKSFCFHGFAAALICSTLISCFLLIKALSSLGPLYQMFPLSERHAGTCPVASCQMLRCYFSETFHGYPFCGLF